MSSRTRTARHRVGTGLIMLGWLGLLASPGHAQNPPPAAASTAGHAPVPAPRTLLTPVQRETRVTQALAALKAGFPAQPKTAIPAPKMAGADASGDQDPALAMRALYLKYHSESAAFHVQTLAANCDRMAADLAQDLSEQGLIVYTLELNAVEHASQPSAEMTQQTALAKQEVQWLRTVVQPWLEKAQQLIALTLLGTTEKSDRDRTWTFSDGHTMRGTYLGQDSTTVTVVLDGQTTFTKIPLAKLALVDQVWLGRKPPPTSGPPDRLGPTAQLAPAFLGSNP